MQPTDTQLANDNACLRSLIEAHGRRITDLWSAPITDLRVENIRLQDLLRWVRAYTTAPNRTQLEKQGFCYPPVEAGYDPDSDWVEFTRWMEGKATHWKYGQEFGPLPDEGGLRDADILGELQRITERLNSRGILVDLQGDLPPRIAYICIKEMLEQESFDYLTDTTQCHLTGCSGYCPGCIQRPWCPEGLAEQWPEDEEEGFLVSHESVQSHMPASLAAPPLPTEPASETTP